MLSRFVGRKFLIAATGLLFAVAAASAQTKPFTPGDIFIDVNGDTMQVLRCRGESFGYECQLRRLAASGNHTPRYGENGWWAGHLLRDSEESWVKEKGGAPYSGPAVPLPSAAPSPKAAPAPGAPTRAFTPSPAAVRTQQAAAQPAGGQCPKTPYAVVPGSQPASEATFRQAIASGHTYKQSSYLWTGVTFESVSVGASVKNKITMQPGVGPKRVTDAAPVDTALYPVKATYVLCHQYASGPERVRFQTGKYCFVSSSGNWVCGTDSDVALTKSTPLP